MANDDKLTMATAFSPTSTYLIDPEGRIAARWLDRIHDRATPEAILEVLDRGLRPRGSNGGTDSPRDSEGH